MNEKVVEIPAKPRVCRKCKTRPLFVWNNTRHQWTRTLDWCKECLASSFHEVGCFFCERRIGWQFGFEFAGDGDEYKCCGECRGQVFGLPNAKEK